MNHIFLAGVGAVATLVLFLPSVLHEGAGLVPQLFDVAEEKPTALLFVGDIMLDRAVARNARAIGEEKLFAEVEHIFGAHDLVIGNLEGTITSNPSVSEVDNTILRFTFAPKMAEVLRDAGFMLVSLANNHSLDFGEFGYEDTLYYLGEADITPFGHALNETKLAISASVNERTFCFVGYHELFSRDASKVVEKIIESEPECDFTTLFAHWGVEYEHEPSASQRELAHLFVDAGADLVIGAHPHVVQPVEVYNNTAIFYSLGNFVFDQRWRPEVRRGTMVSVEVGEEETKFTVLPVNTYLTASTADDEVSAAVLADLELAEPTFVLKN